MDAELHAKLEGQFEMDWQKHLSARRDLRREYLADPRIKDIWRLGWLAGADSGIAFAREIIK